MKMINKKVVAREWLLFLASFAFGILILPALLNLIFRHNLDNIGLFYGAIFDYNKEAVPLWLIVFCPYILLQIVRSVKWAIKHLKSP